MSKKRILILNDGSAYENWGIKACIDGLKNILKKIIARIEKLADDPRPLGSEKLTGEELYRVRQGNYRILYSIQDNELTVWVIKIGNRKDIYR